MGSCGDGRREEATLAVTLGVARRGWKRWTYGDGEGRANLDDCAWLPAEVECEAGGESLAAMSSFKRRTAADSIFSHEKCFITPWHS